MDETEELSQLVGAIYDASLDPGLWPSVVEEIAHFVPGAFVNLFSQDAARKSAQAFFTYGLSQEYLDLYLGKYIHMNPLFPAVLFFEVGRILTVEDIMPLSEFLETSFYKEWVRPQGLLEPSMAVILDKSPTSIAGLAVGPGEREGPVTDASLRRMGLIAPHVRRSILIGKVVDLHKVEAAALGDTLDAVDAGTFLLDPNGRIVHANARGLGMLEKADPVRTVGGTLSLVDPGADSSLRESLARAASGDAALGTRFISLPIQAANDERYAAHLLPLTSGARREAGAAYSAVAALFVRNTAVDLSHPVEVLARAFSLTPAEMRVTMMLMQFGGVPEVAPILGLSETTVKTHLHRIFQKTGVNRQADLVKLVAGYLSPR